MANIINGLAKLSIRPDASFLTAFYVTVDQQLQHFNTLVRTTHHHLFVGLAMPLALGLTHPCVSVYVCVMV